MKKFRGLFQLIRFELPFAAGVCVVMGQLFALGAFASASVTAIAFLSVLFVSASILVSNDYFDVESDAINAPERPIPSGAVAPSEALSLSVALAAAGLMLSFLLGAPALACSVLLLGIGFMYNRVFKKSGLPGNLLVSISVGMAFVYGGVSVGMPFNRIVWFFALIAALIDLGEEIAADAMDMEGDRIIQSNSLAIRHGRHAALRFSRNVFFLVIILTAVPFFLRWFPLAYVVPIGIMDLAIAYSALCLPESDDKKGREHIRRLYLGATAGLLLFLLMKLLGV